MVPDASKRLVTGNRDESAFEDFFRSHYRAVSSYVAGHYTGLDVDEVVASTFQVAWRRFDEIEADTARAWLIGVARNLIRNASRSRRRRAQFLEALVAARPPVSVELAGRRVSPEDLDVLQTRVRAPASGRAGDPAAGGVENLDRAALAWSSGSRPTLRRSGCSAPVSGCAV